MRLGVLQALDVWLAEDLQLMEQQLVQAGAVGQLVQVYAHAAQVGCRAAEGALASTVLGLPVHLCIQTGSSLVYQSANHLSIKQGA